MGRNDDDDDELSVVDQFLYCFRGASSVIAAVLVFLVLSYWILYLTFKE